MTAMLNWYRASAIDVPETGAAADRPAFLDAPFPPVTQPTLVVWGMRDKALLPCQLDGLGTLVPNLDVVEIDAGHFVPRSEEHTSELQSLMRTSYAVFCLKKQTTKNND